ncbi:ComEC/Rec2 family competence protein [Fusobacterium sp. MFO224]|uniref:ComEC/Rec2 family competence protein n=1 Tax=Fusobacterium sp. MFO224 TaxID=3378070 RepID=UPI003851C955
MEKVYIVAIELFVLEILLYFTNLSFLVGVTILFLSFCFLMLKNKELSVYIFPIIFLVRVIFFINFSEINIGDEIYFKTNIINGYGKIIKINNKLYFKNKHIFLERVEDGKYNIFGRVKRIDGNLLEVKILEKEKLKDNRIEEYLNRKIKKIKEDTSNGCFNLLNGVLLGENRYIYRDVKEMFRYSGGAHLLAISGLHIGIIIGLLTYIIGFFKLERQIKNIIILFILTIYVFSIKVSPSVIRAYIMGAIYIVSIIFYEKVDIKKSLALAFVITLILYPNSFSNISFLMSYISVFSIIGIYPKIKIEKDFKGVVMVNIIIFLLMLQIILFPLTLYFFNSISILAFIANLLLTPLGSLFIFLGFISLLLPDLLIRFFFGWVLEDMYNILILILDLFNKIPFLSMKVNFNIGLLDVIFIYFILILIFFYKEISSFIKNISLIKLKN